MREANDRTYHDFCRRFGECGYDTSNLRGEVSAVASAFVSTGTPAAVERILAPALRVQHH